MRERRAQAQQTSRCRSSKARRRAATAAGGAKSIQQVQGSDYAPRQRRIRSIPDTNPVVVQQSTRDGRYSRDGRSGTSNHRGNYSRWTNNWRNDRRYDWRRYRDRNRSIFRIGFYYDPFGFSYRRFSLGSFLYSELLSVELLDQRSVAVSPAAGLRPVPLGALSQRCAAGRHLHRRSGRRDLRLLLVEPDRPLVEGGAAALVAAPPLHSRSHHKLSQDA